MKDNAKNIPCELLMQPTDEKYSEKIRQFQGCPTLAVTKKGRIFAGWYSGGRCEPHMDNYNLLVYSDNGGNSWTEPVLIIPSSKELFIHALDIQLWIDPRGHLHVYWVQDDVDLDSAPRPEQKKGRPWAEVDGYQFPDFRHAEWEVICRDPDADQLEFSAPRYLDRGFLRCKPLVLSSGRWLNFNYDQEGTRYGYSFSDDEGRSYTRSYGAEKLDTVFDETMAYERLDGSIRMLARTKLGHLAESFSYDSGISWTEARESNILHADSRFFVSRTPSGRVILIGNDSPQRTNMTVFLSEDDGESWKYKKCLDTRSSLSYPDADFRGDRIYLTYDRERTGAKEILFASFTEEDIICGNDVEIKIVSRP